jgi:PadR family transcriptional regulator PadR
MVEKIRLSVPVVRVLAVFLENPGTPRYGFDLMGATNLPSGTIYPILARFERAGWMASATENVDPRTEGRPVRRYFTLTEEGTQAAQRWLGELSVMLKLAGNKP